MEKFIALIERLQQKPNVQKRAIVLGASVILTGLIMVIWLSTFTLFPSPYSQTASEKTLSPLASVAQNFGLVISSIKDIWSNKEVVPEFEPTVTPGTSDTNY